MSKALLLENPHPIAASLLERDGFDVKVIRGGLDEDELIAALDGVSVLGIRSKTEVTRKVLAHAKDLEVIGAFCIGTNQIATDFAAERGIPVFNAPYANTRSVVELALGQIIALTRRLTVKNSRLHRGIWDKSADHAHEVRGRTLGIIGYGNIGTQLSVLAEALGMRVIFYDIAERLALGNALAASSLEEVLREADIVSLHVDGSKANENLFGEREFQMMKPGAVFINLSRGFIVDVQALRAALQSGHLLGAAVDVFPEEPKANGDPFSSELAGLDNVILTPHIGGSTLEAQHDIAVFTAGKISSYLSRGSTTLSVNVPNLNLQDSQSRGFRLAFMHHNTPGVMARLNEVFAQESINLEGQALATSGSIGYAITDMAMPISETVLDRIRSSPASIRVRYFMI
ncbi:phosphoglycerate dehydrogenase [Actinomyces minihominis]|uniref:phosphoglycerate dehydrogenase n=1 Tax=Actinomyces minihominis TaxID=2002838 RepID=UPI000C06A4E6|nr:phosphoglycerate dehydrogenase [Actinomyces minihominis]